MERESMEFDVVIVGAGPAGLSAACRIRQLSEDITVCVVEKGAEVGAHILSGAVMDPKAITELFPDWKERGAPLNVPVTEDKVMLMNNQSSAISVPLMFAPGFHNDGNYVISLANVCRWLAEQAEAMGVEIYPGFAAAEVLYNDDGSVKGIATGDMGVAADGSHKDAYMPGMELHAKYTVFSEGCRGHLGKQLIEKFNLDEGCDPQHYGIGFKEIWEIDESKHQAGLVIHTTGWPASKGTASGSYLYHAEGNQIAIGYVVPLSYTNPHVSPFDEFQQWKQHDKIKSYLEGGTRISYGARALIKGGPQSRPKMSFPGGLLIGDDAGTLNFARIKGSHTAMKSGMLAADTLHAALTADNAISGADLVDYANRFDSSWLNDELQKWRNFGPLLHKFGGMVGAALAFIDQGIFQGKLPFTLRDKTPDYQTLKPASEMPKIEYPKPDGVISFDKLSSVFLSNTNHEEDQPCHLTLKDADIPLMKNLPMYDEPAQRYCPAGVYEIVEEANGDKRFQINGQNCVHCKTCDIKDPSQNIVWVTPEGLGGPNYPNM
ncbi:MAG: electron transfer flavoprotein-ubiquinone oxidoreductase [Oceanicoccus sp.]|uniref:electron transfer flavoprotein-ubiquinone oxidoreductase n=1 Tax=Oceanicoccus sp. TaxID=2691044 RepID=UPI0026341E4C|nr:electron transfer flavoprotein-ubiquinone oxidoreductase [Oceanicoccus sp.]MCP3906773.1 electron transfer flavoprotein-ubiquinone oxidoreductase [Oceanicoccus sp.]MDG1773268.1 electron transfer flavoprotein-ubiquinone oxidoreductase [Oceanicoccus sp.]